MTSFLTQLLVAEGLRNVVATVYPEDGRWGVEILRHNPSNSNPYRFAFIRTTDRPEQLFESAEKAIESVEDFLLRNLLEYRARHDPALTERLGLLENEETLVADMRQLQQELGLEVERAEEISLAGFLGRLQEPRQVKSGNTVYFCDGWQEVGYKPEA